MGQGRDINEYAQPQKMSHDYSNPTGEIPFLYDSLWEAMIQIQPIKCKRKFDGGGRDGEVHHL